MLTEMFNIPSNALLIQGEYNLAVVSVSIGIAIFSSYMAFLVSGQAARQRSEKRKRLLLITGSMALGCGVWAMHFIGMLAFDLCTPTRYDPLITSVSILPAIFAAYVAFRTLIKKRATWRQLAGSGALIGVGISTMHYSGMAGMQMAPLLRYEPSFFALSIVTSLLLAVLAVWVKFGFSHVIGGNKNNVLKTFFASIIMGFAISGMHYVGMAAARFTVPFDFENTIQQNDIPIWLALEVAFASMFVTTLVLGTSILFRYRDMATRALKSEKTLRALVNTTVEGVIVVGGQNCIESVNSAITRIYGWAEQELVGKSVFAFIPSDFCELSRPSQTTASGHALPCDTIGSSYDGYVISKQDGMMAARIGVGHTAFERSQRYIIVVSDIRERVAMEKALKENEAKFRSFIDNIPGIAYRAETGLKIGMEFISSGIEKVTGYPAGAFCAPSPQMTINDLFHPEDRELIEQVRNEIYYRRNNEYRIIHKDGTTRWLREWNTQTQNDEFGRKWVDGFIIDITSRKNMENELLAAKNQAEQAAEARATFLANMSHEIRTPMNAIIGFSEPTLYGETTEQEQQHIATINSSARSLLHLLDDILDSAKLDKGKMEIEYRNFVLEDEVDIVKSIFAMQAKSKGLELTINSAIDISQTFCGAPDRVRQVLNNLLGNAIKFTESGTVSVNIEQGKKGISFVVADTGIGMDSHEVAKIFHPFEQADSSRIRQYGGTGLGTFICKQLVELMGGEITVDSTKGKGTTFSFWVPLKLIDSRVPQDKTTKYPQLPPLHILVVDDYEPNLELLKLFLKRLGHTVSCAENGEAAQLKMKEADIKVVLMDLQMPVMDGLSATKARRAFEAKRKLPTLPVIALTASVSKKDKQDAIEAGIQGFAKKPIEFEELLLEIQRVLDLNT